MWGLGCLPPSSPLFLSAFLHAILDWKVCSQAIVEWPGRESNNMLCWFLKRVIRANQQAIHISLTCYRQLSCRALLFEPPVHSYYFFNRFSEISSDLSLLRKFPERHISINRSISSTFVSVCLPELPSEQLVSPTLNVWRRRNHAWYPEYISEYKSRMCQAT